MGKNRMQQKLKTKRKIEVKGMERIEEILDGVKTMGIGGHVRPDGDCVGSCMGHAGKIGRAHV